MPYKVSKFPIFKVSATGNDFLLVDLLTQTSRQTWQASFGVKSRSDLVREWCDRHEGLGADGLVFLHPNSSHSDLELDFSWDFFNSDGNTAEMCGNAARAVSLYMYDKVGKSRLCFNTLVGVVHAYVESPLKIEVALPPIARVDWDQVSALEDIHFDFVLAGVPHAILRVSDISATATLRAHALKVKQEARFAESGVNITFLQEIGAGKVASVTFERGVEDFTLSCGTGAVAAAYSLARGREDLPIEVQVPGGRLSVVWRGGQPFLSGPARVVAEIHLILAEG